MLESFHIGARLGRGRSYARNGQVLSIDVKEGEVKAKVQGSRPQPYNVKIEVKQLTPKQWDQVIAALSGQALFTAKLLAGEMPQDIEEAFAKAKVSLFPEKQADLVTDCSCPDWSNPCKHVAAVYYLLGEEFDRDPFLLFRLRGMGRDELLKRLSAAESGPTAPRSAGDSRSESPTIAEPLPADAAAFWGGGALPDDVFGAVEAPPASAAWLRRLGKFPFWRGEAPLEETLAPTYAGAARRGMDTFLGGKRGPE